MLDEHNKAQETSKKREKLTEEKLIRIKKLQLMTVQRIHQQLRVERAIPVQKDQARQDPYKFTRFFSNAKSRVLIILSQIKNTSKNIQSGTKKTPSPENEYTFFFGFKSLCICKE